MPKKHPISTNHPSYAKSMDKIVRCRDVVEGTDAVKDKGAEYLPLLSSHKATPEGQAKYDAYRKRALFFNGARRTKIGLVGAVTRKAPITRTTREELAKVALKLRRPLMDEQIEAACAAIVVDKRDSNERASPRLWYAENIVNWRYEMDEEDSVLSLLVLQDEEETIGNSLFELKSTTVRHAYYLAEVWEIAPRDDDGNILEEQLDHLLSIVGDAGRVCWYQRFELNDKEEWLEGFPQMMMRAGGVPLDHVPAIRVGSTTINEEPEDPLLIDLVDVNISHYQNSADLEHGRHWTALPTAWASGFPTHDNEGNPIELVIGGESAWISEVPGASCGYLEFSGSGLGHLSEGMKEKKAMMAVLGARLLEEQKAAVEAAETLKTRMAGESSVLSYVSKTNGDALTWTLRELIIWEEPTYEAPITEDDVDVIEIDTDFVDRRLTSGDLQAFVGALQAETISYQTFFEALQKGEIIPPERTIEEEAELIDAGRPGNASKTPFTEPEAPPPTDEDDEDDDEEEDVEDEELDDEDEE